VSGGVLPYLAAVAPSVKQSRDPVFQVVAHLPVAQAQALAQFRLRRWKLSFQTVVAADQFSIDLSQDIERRVIEGAQLASAARPCRRAAVRSESLPPICCRKVAAQAARHA
jgi:hypothetical protein